MSLSAAIRSSLAFAALAAIAAPTFLPAFHALPGMGHDDCGCRVHRSHGHAVHVHVGDAICGQDRAGHASRDRTTSTCGVATCGTSATKAESHDAFPRWTGERPDGRDCLLCDLFADFLLTKPERGFVLPEIDAIESITAPAAPRVEVSARSASCRGPPVAV